VLASTASSLPEIVGDAGVLVDPESTDAITEGMMQLLNNESERQRLVALGYERAKQFTWQETARGTLELYHSLLSS
jgi:glycosyltransferase involved in cell wall biosynthesis